MSHNRDVQISSPLSPSEVAIIKAVNSELETENEVKQMKKSSNIKKVLPGIG
jgi:hypothetical protein